jgi:hypothetical protein
MLICALQGKREAVCMSDCLDVSKHLQIKKKNIALS